VVDVKVGATWVVEHTGRNLERDTVMASQSKRVGDVTNSNVRDFLM